MITSGALKGVDVAIVEALAVTEDGDIIPTTAMKYSGICKKCKAGYS